MIFLQWIREKSHLFTKWDSNEFAAFFPGKQLDAYGTTVYPGLPNHPMILNTYGDEDEYPNGVVFCVCGIFTSANCKRHIELADIFFDDKDKIRFINKAKGIIPEGITRYDFKKSLGVGKRAFYYYRDKMKVSLRIDNDTYSSIHERHRHKEAEKWLSSPRILIGLRRV